MSWWASCVSLVGFALLVSNEATTSPSAPAFRGTWALKSDPRAWDVGSQRTLLDNGSAKWPSLTSKKKKKKAPAPTAWTHLLMASPLLLDEKVLASACSSNRIQDTQENSKEQIRGIHANNGELKKKFIQNSLTGDTFDDTSEIQWVYRQRQKKCGRYNSLFKKQYPFKFAGMIRFS